MFAARPFAGQSPFLATVIRLARKRRQDEACADLSVLKSFLVSRPHLRATNREAPRPRYPSAIGVDRWLHRAQFSPWMDYLKEAEAADEPGTLLHTEFRRKFRIPKSIFNEIFTATKNSGKFMVLKDTLDEDEKQKKLDFLALKILAVLRLFALGVPVDGVSDCARLGRSTIQRFLLPWTKWFDETYYNTWVHMPETEEEVMQMEDLFSHVGLPGCVTSMDGVHLEYACAPAADRILYVGKENRPTIMFNVHCTHNKRIVYMTKAMYGARNDKTVVRDDAFVKRLKHDPLLKNLEFKLLDTHGNEHLVKGAYCLCDGGYHQWRVNICGYKVGLDDKEALFGQVCESVRKDIECVFGILKKRFRILAVPMQFRKQRQCARVFRCCGILHNWLLDFDGHATIGQDEADWMRADERATHRELLDKRPTRFLPDLNSDSMFQGSDSIEPGPMLESEDTFHNLRAALAIHMNKRWEQGNVSWLKPASDLRPK